MFKFSNIFDCFDFYDNRSNVYYLFGLNCYYYFNHFLLLQLLLLFWKSDDINQNSKLLFFVK